MKADAKGRRVDEGVAYPVEQRRVIDEIPHAGSSGFALVGVAGYPADEPLGSGRGQYMHQRRGFADISDSPDMADGQNALVCWQQAARLELHIGRRALMCDGDLFAMPSLGDTSEGAPCFNRAMEFLGLVLESRGNVARIVPGVDLWRSLVRQGHGGMIGTPLA